MIAVDSKSSWEAVLTFGKAQYNNGVYVPNTCAHIAVDGLTPEQAHLLMDAQGGEYRWLSWTSDNAPRIHVQFN
jgi:hypothetical protein